MDINRERDLRFIKEFRKIKLSNICKELKIDKSNVYRGIASAENIKAVKNEIIKRYEKLEK